MEAAASDGPSGGVTVRACAADGAHSGPSSQV